MAAARRCMSAILTVTKTERRSVSPWPLTSTFPPPRAYFSSSSTQIATLPSFRAPTTFPPPRAYCSFPPPRAYCSFPPPRAYCSFPPPRAYWSSKFDRIRWAYYKARFISILYGSLIGSLTLFSVVYTSVLIQAEDVLKILTVRERREEALKELRAAEGGEEKSEFE